MGVKRRGRASKQMAGRLAHPAASLVLALRYQLKGLDACDGFSELRARQAAVIVERYVSGLILTHTGLPPVSPLSNAQDPVSTIRCRHAWAMAALDTPATAVVDHDRAESLGCGEEAQDELLHELARLPLFERIRRARDRIEWERSIAAATTPEAAAKLEPLVNAAESSAAKLRESSGGQNSATADRFTVDTAKIAPPSLSPAAAADAVDASSGANADGGSRAGDQSGVQRMPPNPPDAAAAVDHAPNPSGVVDKDVARIRERLPQSPIQKRVLAVLAKLRLHEIDWLSAGDLDRAGISSKTVHSAARPDHSRWKSSVRGAPAAPKSYEKTAVISYVVEIWTPRAKRPARAVNSSSG